MPPAGAFGVRAAVASRGRQELSKEKKKREEQISALVRAYEKKHDIEKGLSRPELEELLRDYNEGVDPTNDEVEWILLHADGSRKGDTKDNIIDVGEMETVLQLWDNHRHCRPHIEVVFQKYDTERSGRLNRQQLQALLTDLNDKKSPTDDEVDWVLAEADRDKSGNISKPELMVAISSWYSYAETQSSSCCIIS
jgi:Ca2+-binding EF-hand superfamily protein|eukprot:CAMPEP_0174330306 /NCGR_PEP_ID=MMETSP0810-20121108/16556_1 /TAXON_ID=73025 ORGANISM="Eutreptiella gymnastica-like, Strain CCMP1594" /NCGR_SAMPLE_ID=MMETSP0810 /ASSEMBLY_ACC=CAM_ASM_000659 /LENGTH=194 /DNA_ID=CAMNT_0015445363 /DNA_START=38 /DNA_END=622 /DNA_ORIENTATION=+